MGYIEDIQRQKQNEADASKYRNLVSETNNKNLYNDAFSSGVNVGFDKGHTQGLQDVLSQLRNYNVSVTSPAEQPAADKYAQFAVENAPSENDTGYGQVDTAQLSRDAVDGNSRAVDPLGYRLDALQKMNGSISPGLEMGLAAQSVNELSKKGY